MSAVLLVEDYEVLRDLFSGILKQKHECWAVNSAEEAIELLNKRDFNVIIVDVLLPKMNGVELLKFVRQKYPALPVIMMSGGNASLRPEDFKRLGAICYLEKPFPLSDLMDSVKRALSSWPGATSMRA
ncbi:MAG TPA: response regulator [Pyrinomonadaceae bacterium]|jgi:DNA-binding NtrC family response regulator